MTFDERYRVIQSRDARFDGLFITAVRSTGIYCRPSCPARTPKASNVQFFATSAAAHEAGYRACKICLPDAAPGSPDWNRRGDVSARAMRLIASGVIDREGVSGLAARLGYSSRHLTRILTSELGAGPLALGRAQRAQTARMLLAGTELSMSDVAFSAGFSSVRQFNDTIQSVYAMSPSQVRAHRRRREQVTPGVIDLVLPVRQPFDAAGLFSWMQARAIPGVEVATATSYARTMRTPSGVAWFQVQLDSNDRLRLTARMAQLSDLPILVAGARRLFDLDADPMAIDGTLAAHAELQPLVARISGIRVPGTVDAAEQLIRAMVGQQITVAAARTALTRLVELLGEPAAGFDDTWRVFPTMATIAARGHEVLRGPKARISAITGAAAALADGTLAPTAADDNAALRAELLALPGVGPWTADYARMRITGDPDVILPGDVAVRSGAARAGIPSSPRALADWSTRVSPWRSYLTAHLWRAVGAPSHLNETDLVTANTARPSKDEGIQL